MDQSLMFELNENLKKILGSQNKKPKKKTEEEKDEEVRNRIHMKYLKKNLNDKIKNG